MESKVLKFFIIILKIGLYFRQYLNDISPKWDFLSCFISMHLLNLFFYDFFIFKNNQKKMSPTVCSSYERQEQQQPQHLPDNAPHARPRSNLAVLANTPWGGKTDSQSVERTDRHVNPNNINLKKIMYIFFEK